MNVSLLAHRVDPRPDRPRIVRPTRRAAAATARRCRECQYTRDAGDFLPGSVPGSQQRRDWCRRCRAPFEAAVRRDCVALPRHDRIEAP